MTFKQGDNVTLVINGKTHGVGTVFRVGATCLYCWDDDGNSFHSHIENFQLTGKTKADCKMKFNNTANFPAEPQIIGIAGRKNHGKDTAGQGLRGFENVKFAGPLKEMTRTFMRYIGMSEETIERCVEGDMKETPLACFGGRSTRFFMQKLGTEFGREMIWEDIWTSAFQDRARQFEKVVCSDMRFPNEVDLIKRMGGRTVRVVNPSQPMPADAHISETAIDMLPVSMEIVNDGSIWDLHEKMRWAFDPFAPLSVIKTDESK